MAMRWIFAPLVIAVIVTGCAVDMDRGESNTAALEAVPLDSCVVTGLGALAVGDEFDGDVTEASDGSVTGLWDHFTPERTVTVCEEDDGDCRRGRGRGEGSFGCPGRGKRWGHHRGHGRGHDRGRGRGHCGDDDEPDCHDEIVRDHFQGDPDLVRCRMNGSVVADLDGPGTWNGEAGYTFRLNVQDRGPAPAIDYYSLTVFASDGSTHYTASGDLASGDVTVALP